jgi:hypothetical protein
MRVPAAAIGDDGDLVAGLVPAERDPVGVQQPFNLRSHGVEDGGGRSAFRDQRGHPPQGGLLLDETLHLRACLSVVDRGGD